MKQQLASFWYF